MGTEKSAELVVAEGNEPLKDMEDSQISEGGNIELCPDLDRNADHSVSIASP